MDALLKLDSYLENRLAHLKAIKSHGRKVIGFTAGGYFPEELPLACDAEAICFIEAGNNEALRNAGPYTCRWFDPFWRSQIAFLTSGKDPYYNLADLIVVPVTDNHVRNFSNVLGYFSPDKDSFVFGVPHVKDKIALEYFLKGITRLRNRLEEITGKEITDAGLKQSIDLCNRERELFRQISILRKSGEYSIAGRDFIKLHHASFITDKKFMVDILEMYLREIKESAHHPAGSPRLLLTGSTLAHGDTKVMDIIEEFGGNIVVEEFAEGIRPFSETVNTQGDLMKNLAESYFMKRVCPGWFRPGTERLNLLIKLARGYNVDGLVWYQLMFRESYKVESYFFPQMLKKEAGIPMLVLESEYDAMETGPMRTRIETFIETIKR
ncbi:MAG: 2-hydroxyacyl-CoA dehydratase [Deltaproteobacteria bacterium]|nr:2-hydroxyacyl-CoA dehydratase [Deltaproteobacteria bacterium]